MIQVREFLVGVAQTCEQARILNGSARLAGQDSQQLKVALGEGCVLPSLDQGQNANLLSAHNQGLHHGCGRPRSVPGA